MSIKAEAKYIRISPTKVRPVIELVKGLKALEAANRLHLINKRASYYLSKVLKSAIANAKNKGYQEDKLFIAKAIANPGPVLKRHRSAAFGRAVQIKKRTSHISIELGTTEELLTGKKAR